MSKKIIALVGPTATGKSSLAIRLAQTLQTEIISADSRLIYREMDIGTAKPTLEERANVKHHLIDIINPDQDFSLGAYLEISKPLISQLHKAKKIPIVVGGTGFYLRGLLEGLDLTDTPPNPAFRESLKEAPTADLYRLLVRTGWKMHHNDRPRIIRALELERAGHSPQSLRYSSDFEVLWYGLKYADHKAQHEAIGARVDRMLERGLLNEVSYLRGKYGRLDLFQKTIGYRQAEAYLSGVIPSLEDLAFAIKTATNQYRKRQLTWFRTNEAIRWLAAENPDKVLEEILEMHEAGLPLGNWRK